eukprot:5459077-Prorocentrum_lima.AAC.1
MNLPTTTTAVLRLPSVCTTDILVDVRAMEDWVIYGWDILGNPCRIAYGEGARALEPRVGRPYCFRNVVAWEGGFVLGSCGAVEEVSADDFSMVKREALP